jgi:hypothetical protein
MRLSSVTLMAVATVAVLTGAGSANASALWATHDATEATAVWTRVAQNLSGLEPATSTNRVASAGGVREQSAPQASRAIGLCDGCDSRTSSLSESATMVLLGTFFLGTGFAARRLVGTHS